MDRKIFFRPDRCMLCHSCVLACQVKTLGVSEIRSIPEGQQARSRITLALTRGTPWVWTCQHCVSAPCVDACVSGSLRREEGRLGVIHHEESCVGCGSCILVCPYDALKFDEKEGRVVKCNLCMDEETPPCVKACQSRALVYEDPARFAMERKKAFALEMRKNCGGE